MLKENPRIAQLTKLTFSISSAETKTCSHESRLPLPARDRSAQAGFRVEGTDRGARSEVAEGGGKSKGGRGRVVTSKLVRWLREALTTVGNDDAAGI